MENKLKVAIITSGYLPVPASKGGAVENLIQNILDENEKNEKLQIIIYSIEDKDAIKLAEEKYKKSKFIFLKTNSIIKFIDKFIFWIAKYILKKSNVMSYRYIVQRLNFLNKVSKSLKKNNYDKIVLENHSSLFLALKWRKNYLKYKNKYYYHVHNELKSDYGCLDIIKNCNTIWCVSNYIKKQVQKFLKEENPIVTVWRNGIDTNRFNGEINKDKYKKLREKYKIRDEEKVLIFSGRINEEKGVKQLLQAIEKIKYSKFKLLIVGSYFFNTNIKSDFDKQIRMLVNKNKDKVIFTGYVEYNEIPNIYAIADIAVLPSMWEEPAALTVLESMSCGLPIIMTDSGGIIEYVNDKMAIIIKRDANIVENLANAIDELLVDEPKMKKMSKEAKNQSQLYSKSNYYENFIDRIK